VKAYSTVNTTNGAISEGSSPCQRVDILATFTMPSNPPPTVTTTRSQRSHRPIGLRGLSRTIRPIPGLPIACDRQATFHDFIVENLPTVSEEKDSDAQTTVLIGNYCLSRRRGSEFLKTRIISERVEHRIEPEAMYRSKETPDQVGPAKRVSLIASAKRRWRDRLPPFWRCHSGEKPIEQDQFTQSFATGIRAMARSPGVNAAVLLPRLISGEHDRQGGYGFPVFFQERFNSCVSVAQFLPAV